MRKLLPISLFYCCFFLLSQAQNIGFDQWMQLSHPFQNNNLQSSAQYIWWSTPNALWKYDPSTNEMLSYDKTNLLSAGGIQAFAIHPNLSLLVVIYLNGRMDIIHENRTQTIVDWEINPQYIDKTVKHIHFDNTLAYITTKDYLFQLDLSSGTFINIFPISNGEKSFKVRDTLWISSPQLIQALNTNNAFAYSHPFKYSIAINNKIYLYDQHKIAFLNHHQIETIYETEERILYPTVANNQLYFINVHQNDYIIYKVNENDHSVSEWFRFTSNDTIHNIIPFQNKWYGINVAELIELGANKIIEGKFPSYPVQNISVQEESILLHQDKSLWKVNLFNEWNLLSNNVQFIGSNDYSSFIIYYDSISIFSSNNKRSFSYNKDVLTAYLHPNNDLYILNSESTQNLAVYTNDNNWKYYTVPISANDEVSSMIVDNYSRCWISIKGKGIIQYSLINQEWILHNSNSSTTPLISNNVNTLSIDNAGVLWLGSDNGIEYLQCDINNNNCRFIPPIFTNNNSGARILAGENIQSIQIDGSNRKWMASFNGLFLLDKDGTKMLKHYHINNSDLLSNKIFGLNIIQTKGIIVCNTEYGISILKQEAEKLGNDPVNVFVYPNPVSRSQHRSIAIRKIPEGATVKVFATNGQLIKTLQAHGSQVVWYFNSDKITTGVYIAEIFDRTNNKIYQTKIFIIP